MEYVLEFPIMLTYIKEMEEEYKNQTCFVDKTKEWIKKSNLNTSKIRDLNYWIINKKKYYVDNKSIVLDYNKSEEKCAKWLRKTFGVDVFMCPRVNKPEGINTPDYIFNYEYWDLKQINGIGNRTIDTAIKKCKNQAHNFIIDISKSGLSDISAIYQLQKIFNNKNRKWVEKIILKRNDELIKVYIKRD